MKWIILALSVLTISSALPNREHVVLENVEKDPKIFEDIVLSIIEKVRQVLRNGSESLGIPSFEPLRIPRIPVNIELGTTKIQATLADVLVNNITYFNVSLLKISPLPTKVRMVLDWENINSVGSYDTNSTIIGLIPIYGNGSYRADINGFSIGFNASLRAGLSGYSISALTLDFKLGSFVLDLEHFLGGDLGEVIQDIINDNIMAILRALEVPIETGLASFIQDFLNQILQGGKYSELLSTVDIK